MIGPDLEQLAEQLSAYIDDELTPQERGKIEAKLRASAQARRLLEDLTTTAKLVADLPRHDAPSAVAADLHAQLERTALLAGLDQAKTDVVTERPGWFPRLSLAAMIGLVAVGGWWMMAGPDLGTTSSQANRLTRLESAIPEESSSEAAGGPGGSWGGADLSQLKDADVERKLAAGALPGQLHGHPFSSEPIRLEVPVRYESEQAALLTKLSRRLASAEAVDLAAIGGDRGPVPNTFYYRGRPGINHKTGAGRQLLVRVSRRQLDEVLSELGAVRNASDVRLQAGSLSLRGSHKVRTAMTLLASADDEGAVGGAGFAQSNEERLEAILTNLGVDPATFLDGPASPAKAEPTTKLAQRDRADNARPQPLRERREERARSPRSQSSDEAAVANRKMSVASTQTLSTPDPAFETFVTFVIEIPIHPSSSSAPTTVRSGSTPPTSNR